MSDTPTHTGDRLLPVIVIVGGISFLGAALLGIFGDDLRTLESSGADSFSQSAIGHSAFAELLAERGHNVTRGRSRSGSKAGAGLLILAEPRVASVNKRDVERDERIAFETARGAKHILLSLPKRRGVPDEQRQHLASAELVGLVDANTVLDELFVYASVYRPQRAESWYDNADEPVAIDLQSPQLLTPGTASAALDPIVECESGVLLAEIQPDRHLFGEVRLFVLTDPDVMANFTLSRDNDHAWLLARFVDSLELEGAPVVFDEVLHGFGYRRTFWRQLFDYPFVLVTLQLLACAVILAWASFGRFGRPVPADVGYAAGWQPLIANTADLLRYGRHYGHTIGRYFRGAVREVETRLRPKHLDDDEAETWLLATTKRKAPEIDFEQLRRDVDELANERKREHAVVKIAGRIHRWKLEMLNASR